MLLLPHHTIFFRRNRFTLHSALLSTHIIRLLLSNICTHSAQPLMDVRYLLDHDVCSFDVPLQPSAVLFPRFAISFGHRHWRWGSRVRGLRDDATQPRCAPREWDPNSQHPFWVDTKSNPPRSIWTHPYDDEQYLSEHPDLREKPQAQLKGQTDSKSNLEPPPYEEGYRRHSYHGESSGVAGPSRPPSGRNTSTPPPLGEKGKQNERGFFGKLKDRAIGTKEEREEHKRQMRLIQEQRERQRQELMQQRMEYMRQQYAQGYPGQSAYSSRPVYGPPAGNPYAMNGGYGYPGYGSGIGRRGGFGGGGMALPLLGGLAGGLLLGDIIDDGFGGGGFGGGGFDGGYDNSGFF
ncbi:hypothetical protein NEOLEDRAFT_28796 [Neolentinus lepideus HHB14362 ss-1]|uniref:WW domain-containing protein n=1 Tax=Neolentinus lepideus HHB14362 ss-1 TaxID=1314782 RepID=A0A165W5Q4_9AGAM|nr:hypothetical protein NEOLEDRAFT_28796 [Neolentinus lepideus HHB14362 ss-1]